MPFVFVHLIVHSVSLFGEMSSEEPLHLALQSVMIAKNGKKLVNDYYAIITLPILEIQSMYIIRLMYPS